MYAGRHDDILTDYSLTIELDRTNAGLWCRYSHACTTADRRQAASKELGAKTKTAAVGRRNPVKFAGHRSWFFDDSRNRPLATH